MVSGSSTEDPNGSLYQVKRLHKVPELLYKCCDLINMEWKRSRTARMRSIEGSCEDFPMSLILLKNSEPTEPIGHCKISKLFMSHSRVFVETVVIHPDLRGKGLGRFLMNEVEKVCKSKNVQWIYLTTQGQELFYEKLGYVKCAPISIYGSQFNDSNEDISKIEEKTVLNTVTNVNSVKTSHNSLPPPPPLPVKSTALDIKVTSKKTYMRKKLF